MSRGVNRVTIVGTLGKDPEVKVTAGGTTIASVSVATNEEWRDKNTGEKQSRTEWHAITFFGKIAEIAGQYLKKGGQVYIEGKLRTEEYEKDGIKRWSTKIIADELQMLGGKPAGTPSAQSGAQQDGGKPTLVDDQIPFSPRGKRSHWE